MNASASTLLKVGALATRTGISVRTLHHYDDIGLLSPSARTPSGHRLYDVRDVARLQHIQALRATGMSLEEIGEALHASAFAPLELIRLQITRLEERLAQERTALERLQRLEQHFASSSELTMEDFCQVIDATRALDKYFTSAQLRAMYERGQALGASRVQAMQREWAELIPAVRAHYTRGSAPTDPEVQVLARRWRELLQQFTQGDAELARRLRAMAEREPTAATPEPELMDYIGKASLPPPS